MTTENTNYTGGLMADQNYQNAYVAALIDGYNLAAWEVQRALGVSARRVRQLADEGKIRTRLVNARTALYNASDVANYKPRRVGRPAKTYTGECKTCATTWDCRDTKRGQERYNPLLSEWIDHCAQCGDPSDATPVETDGR